jgi:hypothetical protein
MNEPTNVAQLPFRRPVLTTLRDAIKDAVFECSGQISLAEAIGILEIVKHELIEEHR